MMYARAGRVENADLLHELDRGDADVRLQVRGVIVAGAQQAPSWKKMSFAPPHTE